MLTLLMKSCLYVVKAILEIKIKLVILVCAFLKSMISFAGKILWSLSNILILIIKSFIKIITACLIAVEDFLINCFEIVENSLGIISNGFKGCLRTVRYCLSECLKAAKRFASGSLNVLENFSNSCLNIIGMILKAIAHGLICFKIFKNGIINVGNVIKTGFISFLRGVVYYLIECLNVASRFAIGCLHGVENLAKCSLKIFQVLLKMISRSFTGLVNFLVNMFKKVKNTIINALHILGNCLGSMVKFSLIGCFYVVKSCFNFIKHIVITIEDFLIACLNVFEGLLKYSFYVIKNGLKIIFLGLMAIENCLMQCWDIGESLLRIAMHGLILIINFPVSCFKIFKNGLVSGWNILERCLKSRVTILKNMGVAVWVSSVFSVKSALNFIKNNINNGWNILRAGLKSIITTCWTNFVCIAKFALNLISIIRQSSLKAVKNGWVHCLNILAGLIVGFRIVQRSLRRKVKGILNGIKRNIVRMINFPSHCLKKIKNGLVNGISNVENGVKNSLKMTKVISAEKAFGMLICVMLASLGLIYDATPVGKAKANKSSDNAYGGNAALRANATTTIIALDTSNRAETKKTKNIDVVSTANRIWVASTNVLAAAITTKPSANPNTGESGNTANTTNRVNTSNPNTLNTGNTNNTVNPASTALTTNANNTTTNTGTMLYPVYVSIRAKDNTTFSSETTATITHIPFRSGDAFRKGDVLLEFDCRVQKAELRKALAQQEAAASTHKSAKKLINYDAISEQELIKARTDSEIAAAEVDKLKTLVDKCTIIAPYNGKVSEVMVHVGESTRPGDPLLKVVNISNLELQLQVPSVWLEWLKIDADFKITIDEIKKTLSAKVTKINPEIDAVSQTVKIIGIVTTPDPQLLPGMSGQAEFSNKGSLKNKDTKDNTVGDQKKLPNNAASNNKSNNKNNNEKAGG